MWVWKRLNEPLLTCLSDEAAVDWCRASGDSVGVRAKAG